MMQEQSRPSYEEEKTRDPKVEQLQNEEFSRDKFLAVVKRAASRPVAPHRGVNTEATIPSLDTT